jgi:hypothetical protein
MTHPNEPQPVSIDGPPPGRRPHLWRRGEAWCCTTWQGDTASTHATGLLWAGHDADSAVFAWNHWRQAFPLFCWEFNL